MNIFNNENNIINNNNGNNNINNFNNENNLIYDNMNNNNLADINNIFKLAFPEIIIDPNIPQLVIGGGNIINNNSNNNNTKNNIINNNMNNNENIKNSIPNIINKDKEKEKISEIIIQEKLNQLKIGIDSIIDEQDIEIANVDIKKMPNDVISINFVFLSDQSIAFDARINETFRSVVERFKEKNKKIMSKYALMAIHKLKSIKFDKTLLENRITNKDEVFFFKEIDDKNNYEKLDEKDKQQLNIYLDEFKANKFCEYYSNIFSMEDDEKSTKPFNLKFDLSEFTEFVLYKETIPGIHARDHEDILVYSLTDFDWKCNVCQNNYKKNEPRYYCSICDYNMCDKCVEYGQYDKKRSFPKPIPPCNFNFKNKSLKTSHSHDLVFCRTSRCILNETYWYCNECHKGYGPENWSFYCTLCDYDLCCECAKKYMKN